MIEKIDSFVSTATKQNKQKQSYNFFENLFKRGSRLTQPPIISGKALYSDFLV
jgi:hypothetical protein